LIGKGHYGEVRRGVWKNNESEVEVAVKMLKMTASTESKNEEATIMKKLENDNIVKLHGSITAEEPVRLVQILM